MESKIEQKTEFINKIKEISERSEANRKQLRFAFNTDKLAKGQVEVLKNGEFVNSLLSSFLQNPDEHLTDRPDIVDSLCRGVIGEDTIVRERCLALLSAAAEFYLRTDCTEVLVTLSRDLCRWLEMENQLLPGYSIMVQRIEQMVRWFMERCYWREAECLVLLLNRISTSSLAKSAAIRSLAGQVLDNLGNKKAITTLTDYYLLQNDDQPQIKNILAAFGKKAAIYNLDRVIHSQSREERLSLINLIPVYREQVVPVLSECLQNNPPWSVVRNIIYIIAGIGCESNYSVVEQYFHHSDERVQHEMICCVMRLGGAEMVPRLTKALNIVGDRLKTYVIRLLLENSTNDEGFFNALCDLADSQTRSSIHRNHELVMVITAALKTFPCRDCIEVLEKLQARCTGVSGAEQLPLLIEEAVLVVEPLIRHNMQQFEGSHDGVMFDGDPVLEQLARGKLREVENKLKVFVAAGDMERVGKLISAEAMTAMEERDFVLAEMLRDRLIEINPMALSDAIELGEIIDKRKSGSFVSHHIEIWGELYEQMSTEEFNILYSSLREERYQPGEIIVAGGETDNNLFFLNCGYISLGCIVNGKETFLKRMQPGDILGYEQFFSASVWTVSLRALSPVQVQVLDRPTLAKIAEEYPDIENTLQNFCRKYTDISRLLQMSGSDRREFPRFSCSLNTSSRLVDPYGRMSKKNYSGELVDISRGGLAYSVKVSSKAAARLLLGRMSITDVILGDEIVHCRGVIVGVRMQDNNERDYTVHVKLSKQIEERVFRKIISLVR